MTDTKKTKRLKLQIGFALALSGCSVLAFLFLTQQFPNLWLWLLFTATFVYLQWNAVEINDRLTVSPSVMVALTAAVVFGPESATLGVATMAAFGLLSPKDFRSRRWFEPVANFGQLVISAAVSIYVLELFLPSTLSVGQIWQVAVGTMIASVLRASVNFTLVSWLLHRVYGQLLPWSGMGVNHLSYLGMGLLGGLLGVTYLLVGYVALPLIFTAFFVGHLTFASYSELREAQEATLRGFVKALEAKDLYTRGHTERVAYFAQLIAEEIGFGPTQLQTVRWAALIHDVGKLAVPRDLIRKKARLTDEEYEQMQRHVHIVEDILAEVEFLQPMVQIASSHHAHYDGSGYGGSGHVHGQQPGQETCILAVADAFDAMTSSRSYRMALSQEYAFEELRRNAGSQFDPEIVEVFIGVLTHRGERYGSSDLADEDEARRLAEAMEGYRIYG